MASAKKQTVDYFPHACVESKTLVILQSHYGNDGYTFWNKLLQLLGRTDGHAYDYNDPAIFLYLVAETNVEEEQVIKMLETCANLGMIDKELWQKKIIWIQHFVDGVADAYKRRIVGIPQRPGTPPEQTEGPKAVEPAGDILDPVFGQMAKDYESNIGMLTPVLSDKLALIQGEYPEGWFKMALDESLNQNVKKLSYIKGILERWKKDGINPLVSIPPKEKAEAGRTQEYKFD